MKPYQPLREEVKIVTHLNKCKIKIIQIDFSLIDYFNRYFAYP